MKNNIDDINGWLYHRIRMCIWKQWKKPRTKARNLIKMGVPEDLAMQAGNTRRGHWFATHTVAVNMAMTKERLINSGFYDLATAYQSVHVNKIRTIPLLVIWNIFHNIFNPAVKYLTESVQNNGLYYHILPESMKLCFVNAIIFNELVLTDVFIL